jgi:hypothetical protein
VLDRCLSSKAKKYTIHELLHECRLALINNNPGLENLSLRQIYYDLAFMKSKSGFSAPITSYIGIDRKKYYYYSAEGYSIFSSSLLKSDNYQPDLILRFLRALFPENFISGILRHNVLNITEQNYLNGFNLKHSAGKGEIPENYFIFLKAIILKKCVRCIHKSHEFVFSPAFLTAFKSVYFVLGMHHAGLPKPKAMEISDDILLETESKEKYIPLEKNPEYYFNGRIHPLAINNNSKIKKYKFKIIRGFENNLIKYSYFPGQKIRKSSRSGDYVLEWKGVWDEWADEILRSLDGKISLK